MHRARTIVGSLGLLLGTLCAAGALAAQGGRVSPTLDILTHVAPLYLAGALLAAVLAAAGRGESRRAGLILAAIGVAAAGALVAPEFLRDTGPKAPPGSPGEIKVIAFNVWHGNRRLADVVSWLRAENPDIVLLEEATPALRNLIVARTGWSVAGARSNDMIFSHKPYLVMRRPLLPLIRPLTWVNATYDTGGAPFEVLVTHTTWPTEHGQRAQSEALRSVVAVLPRERMVLGGDFNSTPWSFSRRRDDAALGLIRRDRAVATWPTGHVGPWRWPAPFPFLPIDHVYAGPGWATTGVRRGPRLGSDHYPLVVTLAPVAPR
jgi:endonuclease/exonuclease/phosphatase (EEP) superfamily protein YafD